MMIPQTEVAECGLACMAMIANHHGHQLDLTTLRNRYSISFKGVNLQQLMLLANQLDLTGRALKKVHRNRIIILDGHGRASFVHA